MTVLGLTGGIGTGKSTVAKMFQALGATVLDADRIAHTLMEPGTRVFRQIRARFGETVLREDGRLDRKRLAHRVFRNGRDLRILCRIVHPAVRQAILKELKRLRRVDSDGVVVLEIPLLFEAESAPYPTDGVVVVTAPRRVAQRRWTARSGFSAAEFDRRSRFQWPLRKKVERADFVVDNGGSLAKTRRQVLEIWKSITGEESHG